MTLVGWPTTGVCKFPARAGDYGGWLFPACWIPGPQGVNFYLYHVLQALNQRRALIKANANPPPEEKWNNHHSDAATLTRWPRPGVTDNVELITWFRREIETAGAYFVLVKETLTARGLLTTSTPPVRIRLENINWTARAVRPGAGCGFDIPAGGSARVLPLPLGGPAGPAQGWLLGKRSTALPQGGAGDICFFGATDANWRDEVGGPLVAFAQIFNELMVYLNLMCVLEPYSVPCDRYSGSSSAVLDYSTAESAARDAYEDARDKVVLGQQNIQAMPGVQCQVFADMVHPPQDDIWSAEASIDIYVPRSADYKYLMSTRDRDALPITEKLLGFMTPAQILAAPAFAGLYYYDTNKWALFRVCELAARKFEPEYRDTDLSFPHF